MKTDEMLDWLRCEHRHIAGELQALTATRADAVFAVAPGGLAESLREISAQLRRHFELEKRLLEPAVLADWGTASPVDPSLRADSSELAAMLDAMASTLVREPGSSDFEQLPVQLTDLSDLWQIHARKVETLVTSRTGRKGTK